MFVAMPRDTPQSIVDECRGYGAQVELVAGVITDAGKRVAQYIAENGGFDLSTLKEPYRVEGKKIMGYELLEDLGRLPDVILYPTGGGTGLIGMWKAFDEMERLGWIGSRAAAHVQRAVERLRAGRPRVQRRTRNRAGVGVAANRRVGTARSARDRRSPDAARAARFATAARSPSMKRRSKPPPRSCGRAKASMPVRKRAPRCWRCGRCVPRERFAHDEAVVLFSTGGNKYH